MTLTQITEKGIKDGEIVNADINASAAIAVSKLANFVTNNADNRVITGSGTANTLNGESTITYANPTLEINTDTSPYAALTLNGNTGGLIQFEDNETSKWQIFGDNALNFYDDVNNASRLYINSSGNLGIGTTSPSKKLDVAGDLHVSAQILNERGTASAPPFSFTDDTDTGMFNISNADLGFSVGGTERMRINSSGKVNVGGTTSDAKFVVIDASNPDIAMRYNGTTSNHNTRLMFMDKRGVINAQVANVLISDGAGDATARLEFATANDGTLTSHMIIDQSGNVGIGTSSPTTPDGSNADNPLNGSVLTVYGDSPAINLTSSTTGTSDYSLINFGRTGSSSNPYRAAIAYKQSDDILHIQANNKIVFEAGGEINTSEVMRLDTGNVGIGMTTVGAALDVSGASGDTLRLSNGSTAGQYRIGRNSVDGKLEFRGTQSGDECYSFGGVSGEKIRFQPNGGISFNGDSAAANALHDYEEGTYTPIMYEGQGSQQVNYTWRYGNYVKIGSVVHVMVSFGIASFNTSGWTRSTITVPFNTAQNHAPFTNNVFSYIDLHGYSYLSGYGDGGGQNGGDNGGLYLAISQSHSNRMEIVHGRGKNYAGVNQMAAGQRVAIQFSYFTS